MADLQLIEELATVALKDNKADLSDWTFKWNNRITSLGLCHYMRKTILLSRLWMAKVTDDEALDTILHEVAHALAWVRFGSYKHDTKWKLMCLELGARPNSLARVSVSEYDLYSDPKWTMQCTQCNVETPWMRKPKYPIESYRCNLCGSFGMVLIKNR